MILEYSPERGVQLAEPFDFCGFKLVLKGPHAAKPSDLKGITLVDHDNALVPIDLCLSCLAAPRTTKPGKQPMPRWSQARASAAGLTLKQMRFAHTSKEGSDQKNPRQLAS